MNLSRIYAMFRMTFIRCGLSRYSFFLYVLHVVGSIVSASTVLPPDSDVWPLFVRLDTAVYGENNLFSFITAKTEKTY